MKQDAIYKEAVGWIEKLQETLTTLGRSLVTCESCTGGLVGDWITDLSGVSSFYLGGVQAYANEVKASVLKVPESLLENYGAVSAECAAAMAEGGRSLFNSDYAIATTGVAGPGGGTAEKPVGLVYTACAGPEGTRVERHLWTGDRVANKASSALGALKLAVQYLGDE